MSKCYINFSFWIYSLKVLCNFVYKKRKIINCVDKKINLNLNYFGEVYYVFDLYV